MMGGWPPRGINMAQTMCRFAIRCHCRLFISQWLQTVSFFFLLFFFSIISLFFSNSSTPLFPLKNLFPPSHSHLSHLKSKIPLFCPFFSQRKPWHQNLPTPFLVTTSTSLVGWVPNISRSLLHFFTGLDNIYLKLNVPNQ